MTPLMSLKGIMMMKWRIRRIPPTPREAVTPSSMMSLETTKLKQSLQFNATTILS